MASTGTTGNSGGARALVVDDSAFMRKMVAAILTDSGIEVAGTARDGVEALQKASELAPTVITLDLEMPRMDGVAFLRELMRTNPTPVVVLSSLTETGAAATVKCLELGAFACLHKPSGSVSLDIQTVARELAELVRGASRANRRNLAAPRPAPPVPTAPPPQRLQSASRGVCDFVVAIASSTGGPVALQHVIPFLPGDLPAGVVIVQHLPAGFAASLAASLTRSSALEVREAKPGDEIERGVVLIAPGGAHTIFDARGRIALTSEPAVWGVRPAADLMMQSAAERFGPRAIGVVLTGMGRDGATGARAIRSRRGYCIAQDEASSVIYGMPRAAVEVDGVDRVVPLDHVASAIQAAMRASTRAAVA